MNLERPVLWWCLATVAVGEVWLSGAAFHGRLFGWSALCAVLAVVDGALAWWISR